MRVSEERLRAIVAACAGETADLAANLLYEHEERDRLLNIIDGYQKLVDRYSMEAAQRIERDSAQLRERLALATRPAPSPLDRGPMEGTP